MHQNGDKTENIHWNFSKLHVGWSGMHTCQKFSWGTPNLQFGLAASAGASRWHSGIWNAVTYGAFCDRGSSEFTAAPSSLRGFCGFRGTETLTGDNWWLPEVTDVGRDVVHSWLGKYWDLVGMFWARCCKESGNVVCILKYCVGLLLFVCGLSNAVQWHRLHHLISFQFWLQLPAGDSELPTVIKMLKKNPKPNQRTEAKNSSEIIKAEKRLFACELLYCCAEENWILSVFKHPLPWVVWIWG